MLVIHDIDACRRAVQSLRSERGLVGLVPTMGALHEGHLALVRRAREECQAVAVSIFLNPTQFGPQEDLSRYPVTLEADLEACSAEGTDLVFAPTVHAMYPGGEATRVRVERLSRGLCGAFRPGHFEGVATVVAKLFNIMPADRAYFGEKDWQQLQVVRQMVRDLNFPIEIVPCPTIRADDGLALSSRNAYLSEAERLQAGSISAALRDARERAKSGEQSPDVIVAAVRERIRSAGPANIEYIELVDPETLEPLVNIDRPARLCVAVRIGETRLIDNSPLD